MDLDPPSVKLVGFYWMSGLPAIIVTVTVTETLTIVIAGGVVVVQWSVSLTRDHPSRV